MADPLNIVYFPAAVALGALHALEPGHAKALTASYLIGIKGTKRDSIILGLSVAATHSIVVIVICSIGIWLGNEAFTGSATGWLERGSGLIAIAIGSWMLWRRLFRKGTAHDHHHESEPITIAGRHLQGTLEIVNTPLGEKMRFTSTLPIHEGELIVEIEREENRIDLLHLDKSPDNENVFLSLEIPSEPHEFSARLILSHSLKKLDKFDFSMLEPEHHDHSHLDDIAHAKAHAETLPEYTKTGEKPSIWQIIMFGAAGGMIPCPASITVMLLALSSGRAAMGFLTVLGFSLGLALALVGIGLIVVMGLSKLSDNGRFAWITKRAPVISAGLVIVSGLFALVISQKG
jgi:nickel/cobalt exporter